MCLSVMPKSIKLHLNLSCCEYWQGVAQKKLYIHVCNIFCFIITKLQLLFYEKKLFIRKESLFKVPKHFIMPSA